MSKKYYRKRNLIFKILNYYSENKSNYNNLNEFINKTFTESEMGEKFYFKVADIKDFKEELFDERGQFEKKIKKTLEEYCDKHNNAITLDEEKLDEKYFQLKKSFENNSEKSFELLKESSSIAENLHWRYLPVYDEQFFENADKIPEDNLSDYYNHFHAIEDLYRYIYTDNKINWRSLEGDCNLNKVLTLRIYTTRWGHYDTYKIKRTNNGWDVRRYEGRFLESEKNGDGSLIEILRHDGVCYPNDGLKYALELLWNEADKTEMPLEELQQKLNDISEWIKAVEVATHESQPEWCRYY